MTEIGKELMDLPVELTPEELDEAGHECARLITLQEKLSEEKKTLMASYRERLNKIALELKECAAKITSGMEERQVCCRVVHDYVQGQRLVIREDTGEVVTERTLRPDERQQQLFATDEMVTAETDGDLTNLARQDLVNILSAKLTDALASSADEDAPEPAVERGACVNPNCNSSGHVCLVLECPDFIPGASADPADISQEEIAWRDSTCGEWRECSHAGPCFEQDYQGDPVCLKDVAAKSSPATPDDEWPDPPEDNDGVTYELMEHLQVPLPDKKLQKFRIQIHVVQGQSGNWYSSHHLHTGTRGHSYLPFPKFSEKYPTRAKAIEAALVLVYNKAMDYVKDDKVLSKVALALTDFAIHNVHATPGTAET